MAHPHWLLFIDELGFMECDRRGAELLFHTSSAAPVPGSSSPAAARPGTRQVVTGLLVALPNRNPDGGTSNAPNGANADAEAIIDYFDRAYTWRASRGDSRGGSVPLVAQ